MEASGVKRITLLKAAVFIAILVLSGNLSAQDIDLAIVYSDSLNSTIRTIKGIKGTISKRIDNARFHEYRLSLNNADNEQSINEIRNLDPALILTVGSHATQIVSDGIKNKPIIFSAVLNPETSGFVESLTSPGGNITGSSLDIPFNIQFTYFKKVIADIKKVGVLYSSETANLIPPAKVVAEASGFELVAIKIESEKEIPTALEKLALETDGIWSVADAGIFNPRSTRFILLNTLRRGIPFMGFSRNLVESGALFALDFDYKDIGRQAGKIAVRVLNGRKPDQIPVAVPEIVWFHYNEKTAKHININIPEDLIAIAKEVYR
jgi:putative tryptophan/tyrosine transport system substrate-binding protein